MGRLRDDHTKWNKAEREDKHHMILLTCKSKTGHKWTCLQNRKRLTHVKNRLVVTWGRGLEQEGVGGWGQQMWAFIHRWIDTVLLHNTGATLNILWYTTMERNIKLVCVCSVTKLCPTLCDPMDCSTPGSPVLHYLLELAQTHVHWVHDAT